MESQKDKQESIEILLVDKEAKTFGRIIEGMLKPRSDGVDYSVTAIERIDEGLDYINNKNPNLAIIALANKREQERNKEKYWGNTTTEDIKESEYPGEILIRKCVDKGLPLIVSSGHDEEYVEKVLNKYGIKHSIPKPGSTESVVKAIENVLYNQPSPQSAST